MIRILLAVRSSEIETLSTSIQAKGYEIITYSSLEKNLESLKNLFFHVAVIDDNFDGLGTGWVLAESIRNYYGQSPVIIIVDTSQRFNAYFSDKTLEGKFDWILSTPFSVEELLVKIEFRLSKKQK